MATERASVDTTSISRSRRASAEKASALRAAKKKASRSDLKRRSMPGRRTLTATGLRAPSVSIFGAMHLRDRCSGHGGTEARVDRGQRLAERGDDGCLRLALRKRRHLVLQAFQIARDRRADDVRSRGEELAELDVSRPELAECGGKPAFAAFRTRPLEKPRDGDRGLGRQRQGPRVDQREHALARKHKAGAGKTERDGKWQRSQAPTRVERDDAAGHRRERDATKAGSLDHLREGFRFGKFANRFDEILIGLAVAGHRLADTRDHLERIELVERVEAGHVDRGKFQAQEIGRRS